MKKIIMLLVMLLLASSVNAAWIGFVLSEGSVVEPGSTVTIDVIADLPCAVVEIGTVSDFGAGGAVIDQGTMGQNPTYSSVMGGGGVGAVYNYNGILFEQSAWLGLPGVEPWIPLVSFDYIINPEWDGVSDILIAPLAKGTIYEYAPGLFDTARHSTGGLYYEYPNNIMPVDISGLTIPEPATLLLFGLGGFVLRRRFSGRV